MLACQFLSPQRSVSQVSFSFHQIYFIPHLFSGDQIKTFVLQVYVSTTYKSPVDSADLGTMWLGYIPSNVVDVLAAEIKAKQSKFYMGVPGGVAVDLADCVNAGFNLRSVSDNGGTSGTSGSTVGGDRVTGAMNADSKSRQDAIIHVVSALGAIALLVLMFLVHRSMKRSSLVK